MAIDLLNIQPHKVSRDLSGYITYIYGPGGAGKTTFGAAAPKPLLIAFEKGYNALPGVMAQDVTSWVEMKQILRELKKPEVKNMFRTIIIDTADIASQLCEKYLCTQLGIENIGDGGWTVNGWSKVKREWENTFRTVAMEGYAVIFISHSKTKQITRKDGTTYDQIVPSCSTAYNEIIKNMCDLQGYISVDNGERRLVLRSADDTIECKSRFKMIEPVIEFSYDNLVKALNDAIDKEAALTDGAYVTEEKEKIAETKTYDYDSLIEEFQQIIGKIMEDKSNNTTNSAKITQVIETYLGKGKKIVEATRDQAELIYLIVDELKEKFAAVLA